MGDRGGFYIWPAEDSWSFLSARLPSVAKEGCRGFPLLQPRHIEIDFARHVELSPEISEFRAPRPQKKKREDDPSYNPKPETSLNPKLYSLDPEP